MSVEAVIETILDRLPPDQDLYSLSDLAAAIGLSPKAMTNARSNIPLEPVRKGRGRKCFYTREQIELCLLAQCLPTPRQKRTNRSPKPV